MKKHWNKNYKYYLQEALGLAIFMISCCFFVAMLEGKNASWHQAIHSAFARTVITGILMGSTALFIFYSPLTSASGAQINPAVTLAFLSAGKISRWDALFYIIFQFIGGTVAVYIMQWLIGNELISSPVNTVVTVPNKGNTPAFITEFTIAFITMSMVLFTSHHEQLKKYTRIFAGCLVCTWVIVAGPISGFGMNPARSFASALPAHTWTSFWIYLTAPVAGMLLAVQFFFIIKRKKI
jgi:aquaporin Z